MKRFDFLRGYIVILGGFLIHLSLGSYYISGKVNYLIIDYMNNHTDSSPKSSSFLVGSTLLGLGAAVSLGGFIEMKIGSKFTALLGGWFASFNICLVYFTLKTYWSIVVITYGLFVGFGAGIAYGVAIGTPVKWFSVRRGLIFGIISSAFGLSPGIFVPIQLELLKVTEKNLPMFFPIMGLIMAILQLLGACLLKNKSEENLSELQCIDSTSETIFPNETSPGLKKETVPHNLIFITDFWILWFIISLNSCSYTIFIMLYTENFEHLIKKKVEYPLCFVLVCAFSNFFGRIFWGFLVDKISFKKIMLVLNLTSSLFLGTFSLMNRINESFLIYIYLLWVMIITFCYSGHFSVLPAICGNVFGMKYFACNYGMIFTGCSVGASIVGLIIYLIPTSNQIIFVIGCLLSFLAFVITFLHRGKPYVVRLT